jgi:hypothetical protein
MEAECVRTALSASTIFFKKANPDKKPDAYFFEDFAKIVLDK